MAGRHTWPPPPTRSTCLSWSWSGVLIYNVQAMLFAFESEKCPNCAQIVPKRQRVCYKKDGFDFIVWLRKFALETANGYHAKCKLKLESFVRLVNAMTKSLEVLSTWTLVKQADKLQVATCNFLLSPTARPTSTSTCTFDIDLLHTALKTIAVAW